jgi:hypothetical protein
MNVVGYVCSCYIRDIQRISVVIIIKHVYLEKYIDNNGNRSEKENNEKLRAGK